jgi:hypothetical protein
MRYLVVIVIFWGFAISQISGEQVRVSGRKLLVDGKPYFIKGVCYHPVAKGSKERSFEMLDRDLDLMVEAGINTIRVYQPIADRAVLDKIQSAGLKIIVSFGYNQDGHYDILSGTYIDYVNAFKTHDAILMWELGNEYNYHPEWFDGDNANWYAALNNAAREIHKTDTCHLVGTAHGELPDTSILSTCPNIDVWGLNVYRWDNPASVFEQWSKLSEKPMYLSEAGADSYMTIARDSYQKGVNEQAQANAMRNILKDVFDHPEVCNGVAVFAFVDEWWKAGDANRQDVGGWAPNSSGVPYDGAANEEFWGIVDIERNKKEAYNIVKEIYSH